jgi:hypothetical protein
LDGITNLEENQTQGNPFESGGNAGILRRDIWNVPGNTMQSLTGSANFPKAPNLSMQLRGSPLSFEARGDNYGDRIRGCLVPPVSGSYQLWIAGDDATELWLSADRSRLNKRKIAFSESWTAPGAYETFASQKSALVSLTAGIPYYYEILHKEATIGDYVSVAWNLNPTNLASSGTASQSSTYLEALPSYAINGDTTPTRMSHTLSLQNSWWKVDLGSDRLINKVVLWNRTDAIQNQQRLSNFRVSVLDASGNEIIGQNFYQGAGYVNGSMAWDLPAPVTGRTVKVQFLGYNNMGNGYLCLAEVQVFNWQPMSTRQVVAAQDLRSEYDEPLDLDEDSLPDAWESAHGLSPVDGGATDPMQGEYGDLDGDLMSNLEEYGRGLNPNSLDRAPGRLLIERWNNVSAYSTSELIASSRIYSPADSSFLAAPQDLKFPGEYFGTRSRGYLTPVATGDYTFWISSRTGAQLWLSSSDLKGKYAKQLLAQMDPDLGSGHGIGWKESNLWDRFASQRSIKVHLESGHSYYLEIIHQHGHTLDAHSSVAWALNDGPRQDLPASVISSYHKTADDLDDDYLPDSWEAEHGLNVVDCGQIDPNRQGERGDYDGDGLTNREEYLLGTDPAQMDTDGDGVSDFDEVKRFGTSPIEGSSFTASRVDTVDLANYNPSGSSGSWQMFDGGLLGSSFRGHVEWSFTVPSDGWWVIDLGARLRGDLRPTEEVPLGIKIDNKALAPETMRFLNGQASSLKLATPYLTAGNHTFGLEIRNEVGRRTLQIQSLSVSTPGGADIDGNGRPDWLDSLLAKENGVLPFASESVVSPLFIEGSVRYTGGAAVTGSGQSINVSRGLGDLHWFANVDLDPAGGTPIQVDLETGRANAQVAWTRWNAMGAGSLTIRSGDSVKIGAWQTLDDANAVQITVIGQTHNLLAAESFVQQFSQPGNYVVSVVLASGVTTTNRITVVSADFGQPMAFYSDVVAWRSFPGVPAALKISGDPSLFVDDSVSEGTGQSVKLRATSSGSHVMAARIPGGPIVGLGVVTTLGIADALRGDAAEYIGSTEDGYRILRTPIVVTDLPPGGRVVLTIFRAGVTFLDGTTVKTLTSADFVEGVAYVDFRYPAGMTGGYCHYIDVYDAQNRYLGRR